MPDKHPEEGDPGPCAICGRPGKYTQVWGTGKGGIAEGPFGPVIYGSSVSVPWVLCPADACQSKAQKATDAMA